MSITMDIDITTPCPNIYIVIKNHNLQRSDDTGDKLQIKFMALLEILKQLNF